MCLPIWHHRTCTQWWGHVSVDMVPGPAPMCRTQGPKNPTLDSRHQMARIPPGSAVHLHEEIWINQSLRELTHVLYPLLNQADDRRQRRHRTRTARYTRARKNTSRDQGWAARAGSDYAFPLSRFHAFTLYLLPCTLHPLPFTLRANLAAANVDRSWCPGTGGTPWSLPAPHDMIISSLTGSSINLPLPVSHLSMRPSQPTSANLKPAGDPGKSPGCRVRVIMCCTCKPTSGSCR